MSIIKLVDTIEADPDEGRYDTPQGVMEFLSEVRRTVMAHETKLDTMNRGNDIHTGIVFETGGAPGLRTAIVTSWSRETG